MAGSANWDPATNKVTFSWTFPSAAAALRAVESLLGSQGVDFAGRGATWKVGKARDLTGAWWKREGREWEKLRDSGIAAANTGANFDANVDLS